MSTQKFLGLRYSRSSEPNFKLDLWVRDDLPAPPPVVLFFRGGGFTALNGKPQYDTFAQLIVDHGFAWVNVDYGLAPTYIQPAPIQHGFGALRWLRKNWDAYAPGAIPVDRFRVAVAGGSAGGILASMMHATQNDPTIPGSFGGHTNVTNSLQALVAISGAVHDPDLDTLSVGASAAMQATFGCPDLHSCPNVSYLAQHHLSVTTPALFVHGDADPEIPIAHAQALVADMQAVPTPATLVTKVGGGHGIGVGVAKITDILAFLDGVFA